MSARRSTSLAQRLARAGLLAALALLLASPGHATFKDSGGKDSGGDGFGLHIQFDAEDGFDFEGFEMPRHRPMAWPMPGYADDKEFDREAVVAKLRDKLREKLGGIGDDDGTRLRTLFRKGLEHLRERRGDRIKDVIRRIKDQAHRHHRDCGHGGGGYEPKPPVVPEPSTALLIGLGLAGLGHAGRRVRR